MMMQHELNEDLCYLDSSTKGFACQFPPRTTSANLSLVLFDTTISIPPLYDRNKKIVDMQAKASSLKQSVISNGWS